MSNILTIPASGSIYFDSGTAGSSTVPDLTGSAVSLSYNGDAGLNITSYNALSADRFSVDGSNGRLFSISDSLTGTIFSVNDAAGLPIIEVESDTVDTVTIGTYGTNALVVNDDKVGIGTTTPNEKLTVSGNLSATGSITAATATIPEIQGDTEFTGAVTAIGQPVLSALSDNHVLTKSLGDEAYGKIYTGVAATSASDDLSVYWADDEVSITVPAGVYDVEMVLMTDINLVVLIKSTGSDWPTGAAGGFSNVTRIYNGGVQWSGAYYVNTTSAGRADNGGAYFKFVHKSSSTETLQAYWKQHTSTPGTPTVRYPGSYIKATKIADI